MDSLLFDLLTTVSPYGKESLISDIILKAINKGKKHKKKVISRLDVKGNLIVQVGDYKNLRLCSVLIWILYKLTYQLVRLTYD